MTHRHATPPLAKTQATPTDMVTRHQRSIGTRMRSLGRHTRARRGDRAARDASWGRAGETGVLAVRAFRTSDRFEAAWARMAAPWRPPEAVCWANDDRRRLAQVA